MSRFWFLKISGPLSPSRVTDGRGRMKMHGTIYKIRKIIKNGRNSYYINIPKEIMKELKFKERQKSVVKKRGKGILMNDWER